MLPCPEHRSPYEYLPPAPAQRETSAIRETYLGQQTAGVLVQRPSEQSQRGGGIQNRVGAEDIGAAQPRRVRTVAQPGP